MESSNCECECDKSCGAREYLDYGYCKCRKKLVDKLLKNVVKKLCICLFAIEENGRVFGKRKVDVSPGNFLISVQRNLIS